MSEFYCPQPWTGGFFTTEEQKVCCGHQGVLTHSPAVLYSHDLIKNIRAGLLSGNVDKHCLRCKNEEEVGIKSLRKTHLEWHTDVGIPFEKDIDYPYTPKLFEVRLSNLCNYRCRMCTPNYSSSIDKEIKKNPELKKWYAHQPDVTTEASHLAYQEEFLNDIIEMIPNMKAVHFTGGEPMLIPDLNKIVDSMDSQGYISDIMLYLTTNVSTINPRIIDKLNKFKKVFFTLSIDGVGDVAEYIRDGTIWSKVNANIEYYGQFKVNNPHTFFLNSNTVLTAYSVLTIDKTVEYLCELQRNYKFHLTMSVADLHFHPNVLQGKARNKAIESLSKALVILDAPDISADGIKSQLISVKTILENSEPDDKWEDFVNYTMDIDTARNQNFENVFGLKLSNSQNT
jgi:sulfatase maturation enzyme AslB (radical SAM superfamily)